MIKNTPLYTSLLLLTALVFSASTTTPAQATDIVGLTPLVKATTPPTKTTITTEKPISLIAIPISNPATTLMNASVVAFPFALKNDVTTAITQAQTIAYSTEETFSYAMPAVAEKPKLLASANYNTTGSSYGVSSPRVKKPGAVKRFFQRLFRRKAAKPIIPTVGAVYTLPTPWQIGQEPTPTVNEQLLMNFIHKTNTKWDATGAHVLATWLIEVGDRYEVDPRVLASLIAVESSFRPDAVSSSNAKGFGQLKDDTAKWLGVDNAFDPYQNLQGTAKYLQILGRKFPDDASKAIGSYYVGQGTVERQGMTDSAWYYVGKVQRYLDELLQQSAGL
jgi:Transglycosylase SLT domain